MDRLLHSPSCLQATPLDGNENWPAALQRSPTFWRFFSVVLATTGEIPQLAMLLFAAPRVLHLLAWHYDERRGI
jgi:hypothetical protein